MRRALLVSTALLAAVLSLAGCGDGIPRNMPDVTDETMADAVSELQDKGFSDITLFSSSVHATDPWDGFIRDDAVVTLTKPEAGDDSEPEVLLWVGEAPELPSNVPEGAWYYEHGDRIAQRGTDGCLTCHEPDWCTVCHEGRLEETDKLFSVDPEPTPDLAVAVSSALDISTNDVEAVYRGDDWYQIDIDAASGDPRQAALAARDAAVILFPASFAVDLDIQTLVIRWMSGGEPMIEIGFEKESFDAADWDSVEPSDIPWIADRYAVPSG